MTFWLFFCLDQELFQVSTENSSYNYNRKLKKTGQSEGFYPIIIYAEANAANSIMYELKNRGQYINLNQY